MEPKTFKVAVLGAGYAGFNLARLLDPYVDVTLIEAREAFVHNVAAPRAVVDTDLLNQITIPYDRLLKNGRVIQGRGAEVDAEGITLTDGQRIAASAVVIATGSHYAAPFKPQGDDVTAFRNVLRDVAKQVSAAKQIVIVGAGAVGIEFAGEIRSALSGKSVTLVSGGAQLLPMYPQKLHAALTQKLTALGVALHLGQSATNLTQTDAPYEGDLLLADGTRLSGLIIPAVGARVANSPAHQLPGIQKNPNGQLKVDAWLRPSSLPNVFAVGDLIDTGEGMTVVSTTRQTPWLAALLRKVASGAAITKQPAYEPWKVAPILLPIGPKKGAMVVPMGRGFVAGDFLTSAVKGKTLFIPRYQKEFGRG